MNKFGKTGLILAMVFCVAMFCGCADEDTGGGMRKLGTFEGLSAETELRILQDVFDTYVKPVSEDANLDINIVYVHGYGGSYKEYVVVDICGIGARIMMFGSLHTFIDDVLIVHEGLLTAWKDGQVYELAQAYDLGLLTKDDLNSIANRINGGQK